MVDRDSGKRDEPDSKRHGKRIVEKEEPDHDERQSHDDRKDDDERLSVAVELENENSEDANERHDERYEDRDDEFLVFFVFSSLRKRYPRGKRVGFGKRLVFRLDVGGQNVLFDVAFDGNGNLSFVAFDRGDRVFYDRFGEISNAIGFPGMCERMAENRLRIEGIGKFG